MNSHYYLSPIALGLAIALAFPVKAAVPMPLYTIPFEKIQQSFQLAIPDLTQSTIPSIDSLRFVSEVRDSKHLFHIRLQQYYAGVLVFGGYAIMHSTKSAKWLTMAPTQVQMTGIVYPNLETELEPEKPHFRKNTATALFKFKENYANQKISDEQAIAMVYMDSNDKPHWAYKVSVLIQPKHNMPQRPTAILDADTYKPLIEWDDVKTQKTQVRGMGYGGNVKTGLFQYGSDLPWLKLTRDTSELCFMQNKDVMIINMGHHYSALKRAMTFPCPTIPDNPEDVFNTGPLANGYDEINGAFSPGNDALYAGNLIKNMYYDWYKTQVLTKSDGKSPMPLVMRIHYGEEYANAFWDGKQMTFGDGGKDFYPLVSLGVAAHEISHGFTEQHSDLTYYGEPGGMNESFSDMAAQMAEYYASGKNNWQIAGEIMKNREALRYMDLPSKDGKSFNDATQYYTAVKKDPARVEVHSTSGVYNHLFYILANQANWGIRKAFDVMVKANMYYWGPYDGFKAGGCGILYAAKDLGYSLDDVKKSLKEVAIDYEMCS